MSDIMVRRSPIRMPRLSLFGPGMFDPSSRLFDLAARMPGNAETVGLMPAVEITESDTEFTCTTELPGLTENDVEVTFADDELRIKGEKKEEKESKTNGKRYHVWERSYGAFERSFSFSSDVDPAKIAAEFKNGVLTVRLPKATNGKRAARSIPVSAK